MHTIDDHKEEKAKYLKAKQKAAILQAVKMSPMLTATELIRIL